MTLNQIRIFVLIAELGHVTRAAERLGITQSAASAAVAALETQYEIKLFNRVGRSIQLSETGEHFLAEAQALLSSARAAQRHLRELGGKTVGKLDIAASQTIANYWLPRRLAAFHDRFPEVTLNVTISNTRDVEKAVVDSKADVGFVEGSTSAKNIERTLVDHDQLALVVSSKRWPKLGSGNQKIDLVKLPWIIREQGSGTREVLEDMARSENLVWNDLNIVLELPSNEAVREAVEAGAGATLISRHVVASSLANGSLRALPLNVPPRSYHMLRHQQRRDSSALTALINLLNQGSGQPSTV